MSQESTRSMTLDWKLNGKTESTEREVLIGLRTYRRGVDAVNYRGLRAAKAGAPLDWPAHGLGGAVGG